MNDVAVTKTRERRSQVLALAALVQAVYLADRIARTGQAEPQAFEASLNSLFAFSAEDAEQALGGVENLELGLRALHDILASSSHADTRPVVRYCLGVLHLHKRLLKNPDTASIIRNRLEHARKNIDFSGFNINQIATSVEAIYKDTISRFGYRIQISGSMQQLQNPDNAARIRSLLLAAIRAAFLWRQAGGNRWRLLIRRRQLLAETDKILNTEIPR